MNESDVMHLHQGVYIANAGVSYLFEGGLGRVHAGFVTSNSCSASSLDDLVLLHSIPQVHQLVLHLSCTAVSPCNIPGVQLAKQEWGRRGVAWALWGLHRGVHEDHVFHRQQPDCGLRSGHL